MTMNADLLLYVTRRQPNGLIEPIGILTRHVSDKSGKELFRFVYLKSVEQLGEIRDLPEFPDLYRVYESEHLFPVFQHRMMSRRRPDYGDYVRELNLDTTSDPFLVLARSEGEKVTDYIEVFAPPERTAEGDLQTRFFARGIRHLAGAADAVDDVQPGEVLRLEDDADNSVNSLAVWLSRETNQKVGWVPNYLVDMVHELRNSFEVEVKVTADHVNPKTSPPQVRLLCRLRAPWPKGYEPLSAPEFQPIVS